MKQILLFPFVFNLFSINAQNHLVGLKGGASWTNINATGFLTEVDTKLGMNLGLTYDYMLKKYFSIESGIIYDQRGFTNEVIITNVEGAETGKSVTIRYNYDYLTIPLKIEFNYGKKIYFFGAIGVTPSILVKANWTFPAIEFNGELLNKKVFDETELVNRFDLGGLAEVGFGYKFNEKLWLYSAFSYQRSFTSITNSNYFANSEIRHYGMNANLGLKYVLGKAKE